MFKLLVCLLVLIPAIICLFYYNSISVASNSLSRWLNAIFALPTLFALYFFVVLLIGLKRNKTTYGKAWGLLWLGIISCVPALFINAERLRRSAPPINGVENYAFFMVMIFCFLLICGGISSLLWSVYGIIRYIKLQKQRKVIKESN